MLQALLDMLTFLQSLLHVDDVRPIIRAKYWKQL